MMVGDVLALAEALSIGGAVQSTSDQDFFRRTNANGAFESLFALLISQMIVSKGTSTDSLPNQKVIVMNDAAQQVMPSVIQTTGTISEVTADVLEPESPTPGLVSAQMTPVAEEEVLEQAAPRPVIEVSSEHVHPEQAVSVTLAENPTDAPDSFRGPLLGERSQVEETPARIETADIPLTKVLSQRGVTEVPRDKVLSDVSVRVAKAVLHDSASTTVFTQPKNRAVESEGIPPDGVAVPTPKFTVEPAGITPDRVTSLGTDLRVRYIAHPEKQTFLLHLEPESLGEVRVDISQTRGELSVKLSAATSLGREALMAHASLLKDTLVQQGLSIAQVTVEPGMGTGLWHGQGHAPRHFIFQEPSAASVGLAELSENALDSGYQSPIAHAGALDLFV